MRSNLPLLRTRSVSPARAPILRYGVAVLSTALALIPALFLANVVESRLAIFAVAVMVSAWYGGWKSGLVATCFALTVTAYFSLTGNRTPTEYRNAIFQLTLFVVVAGLICWFNAALRAAQEGLRRSEVNFRSMVTNAPYGICRCDASGRLLDVNPAFVSILGYDSTELFGRHLGTLYRDAQHWFQLADCFRSLKEFDGLAAEWVRKDGSSTVVRLSGRRIYDENNKPSYELFTEDVTERHALEQQLRQAQKMEAIGRLAGGIAHDFNNLLMVISGYSEFLLEHLAPEAPLRTPAQEIANAAQRATSLTRQLLAFSRKQMLAPRVINLNAVITENLKMLNRVIGEDIELEMIPGADLGAVKADPGQIEQVIMNLAVNARDAMPQGGKLIIETANAKLDESHARFPAPVKPGEYVMLAISDTGSGMDGETQSHIFEPFFTTKGSKGTGLGLSTVYGIIKQSGGYIWVDSEPGKGTTFKTYLPRANETSDPASQQPAAAAVQPQRGKETILVVEDEPNLRQLVCQSLENQGYAVFDASSGPAAIHFANVHSGPIHLLLTDVIMPGMNGRELAQRISLVRPTTKIIFMSGYTENAIGQDGTLDASTILLHKPFTLPALKNKVRQVLDSEAVPSTVISSVRALEPDNTKAAEGGPSAFRARRFNLHIPLRYRPVGQQGWRKGTTENISRSGLLFRAEDVLQPNAQLEIDLVLPVEIAGLAATEVFCRGEVVRSVDAGDSARPVFAAKILRYQFQHGAQRPQA
jgi:PAS domain S-box-containing protein